MGALETVNAFNAALNAKQWETAATYLTDDFVFSGVTPQPVGKQEFIAVQQSWARGVPDWHHDLENLDVSGDTARATAHITGTHTGTLELLGMPPFPATGKRFDTRDNLTATLRGDQLATVTVVQGRPGILEQLGAPTPPQ